MHNGTNGWDMLIVAIPAFMGFLTSLIAAYLGFQNQVQIRAAAAKVEDVHLALNSRLTAAIEAAHAAGVAEERAAQLRREIAAAGQRWQSHPAIEPVAEPAAKLPIR